MSKLKRIGILTGGGDCPGLNPAIRAATKKAVFSDIEVVGIRDGWRGLVESEALTMKLDLDKVRHLDRMGGTILGTSGANPYNIKDGIANLRANLKKLELDGVIAIGGEGTLRSASRMHQEFGLNVVAIPKTIDGDLPGTDYTLGFESALQVITECTDSLRSTAESHSRVFVVEVMGRNAGHLALQGGMSAGANVILIPEHQFELGRVCELLTERVKRNLRYSIVFVAEGAVPVGGAEFTRGKKDPNGFARLGGVGNWLAEEIENRTQLESRDVNLSHLQRGGMPVAYDRRMGFSFGTAAVEALMQARFGSLVALKKGEVTLTSLDEVEGPIRLVDVDKDYDKTRYRVAQSILGDDIL